MEIHNYIKRERQGFEAIAGETTRSLQERDRARIAVRELDSLLRQNEERLQTINQQAGPSLTAIASETFAIILPIVLLPVVSVIVGVFVFLDVVVVGGTILYYLGIIDTHGSGSQGSLLMEAFEFLLPQIMILALIIVPAGFSVRASQLKVQEETRRNQRSDVDKYTRRRIEELTSNFNKWIDSQRTIQQRIKKANDDVQYNVERAILDSYNAQVNLKNAESEFEAGAFVAFWDNIEKAGQAIGTAVSRLTQAKVDVGIYDASLQEYQGSRDVPVFCVSINTVELTRDSLRKQAERMRQLSYVAQKNFQFATIYEQRRNTATLIEGFKSLGEAINNMGDKIAGAIYDLENAVSKGFVSVAIVIERISDQISEFARESATQNKNQSERVDAILDGGFRDIANYARFSRDSMKKALENDHDMMIMLNNIQSGRDPRKGTAESVRTSQYGTIFGRTR